ncbi:ABC transporter ATP-binding protein (plasmid) [Streptomyces sp. AHU1]|uniref:ABC transporter ATP-binding protein n=1 Tax=Streptomyces sp. AHU1 TaxID=3377215 RepID=UPI00387825B4
MSSVRERLEMPEYLLHAEELHKSYSLTPALTDASFSISAGEVVAIMGPSGSGKSTLLHCLAGIVPPDSGEVLYRGQDLTKMNDAERSALRRNEFGFVFQFGQLVPELNCWENVALPLRLNGVRQSEARAQATEWLARLDIEDLAQMRPGEISGGQGQRVAVARALAVRPGVIFADEPTGALDSANGRRVMDLFTEAARDSRVAVVLVTHDPAVATYADHEIEVKDGRTYSRELQA